MKKIREIMYKHTRTYCYVYIISILMAFLPAFWCNASASYLQYELLVPLRYFLVYPI